MPPLKRLTRENLQALIKRLGPQRATASALARRTGLPKEKIERRAIGWRIPLATDPPAGVGASASGLAENLPLRIEERGGESEWVVTSGEPPALPLGVWEGLLSEFFATGRARGDPNPFTVLFRDHEDRPKLEARLRALEEEVAAFRAQGAYQRGKEIGFEAGFSDGREKGLRDGYARGKSEWTNQVVFPCLDCGEPVSIDLSERKEYPFARRMLNVTVNRGFSHMLNVTHADCRTPDEGWAIVVGVYLDQNGHPAEWGREGWIKESPGRDPILLAERPRWAEKPVTLP